LVFDNISDAVITIHFSTYNFQKSGEFIIFVKLKTVLSKYIFRLLLSSNPILETHIE